MIIKEYGPDKFVPAGTYLNRKSWEFVHVPEEGGYLKGGEGVRYYRVPVLLVLALAPLIGLAFILFLPLAVPLVMLNAAVRFARRRAGEWMEHRREHRVPAIRKA